MEFLEFVNHNTWSSEGWNMEIEFLCKGTSCNWQLRYAGLRFEGKITVTSASPCVSADLACLQDVPFFPQWSMWDLLEGG